MTPPTQQKTESEASRAAFHREWSLTLQAKTAAFLGMPKTALAYEIAWHAFRAGRESVVNDRFQPALGAMTLPDDKNEPEAKV